MSQFAQGPPTWRLQQQSLVDGRCAFRSESFELSGKSNTGICEDCMKKNRNVPVCPRTADLAASATVVGRWSLRVRERGSADRTKRLATTDRRLFRSSQAA